MMRLADVLDRLLRREDLSEVEAFELLCAMAGRDGDAGMDPALAGALLAALRGKGETGEEIRGFARAMRELAVPAGFEVPALACDLVGTGGDGSHTFNLSTGGALLAAAAGVPIVKHGNRSVSSRSGAADLLEALGMRVPASAAEHRRTLAEAGFVFLFAPAHHPAAARIGPIRRALGVRTVFNVLGPLTNPASPRFGVIGAYSEAMAGLMARALSGMAIERVFVVHGSPGWDEATACGEFVLFDVRPGRVERTVRDPRDVGLERSDPAALRGGDAAENAAALRRVFAGERGAHRDALCLSAALALEVTGMESSMAAGLERAGAAIDDGSAARVVELIVTRGDEGGEAGGGGG
ncbi:MAG: anthranilate phosphoribosyltransferase [Phycisphaerales bacterium]